MTLGECTIGQYVTFGFSDALAAFKAVTFPDPAADRIRLMPVTWCDGKWVPSPLRAPFYAYRLGRVCYLTDDDSRPAD